MGFAGSLEPGSDPPQVLSASGQRSGVKGECLVRVATGRFRATTSGRGGLCRPLGGLRFLCGAPASGHHRNRPAHTWEKPPDHRLTTKCTEDSSPSHQASSPRAGRPRSKRCGMTPSRSLCLRRSERLSERADGNTKRPTAKTTKATKKERCGPAKRGADTARFRLHDPRWSHERCASSFLSVLPFVVRNALPEGSHPFGLDVVLHDHQDQPDQDQRPADDHDNPNQSLGDCRHGQKDREDRE